MLTSFYLYRDSGVSLWNQNGNDVVVWCSPWRKESENFPNDFNMAVRFDDKMVTWLNSFAK
jgi:hypothetical protein